MPSSSKASSSSKATTPKPPSPPKPPKKSKTPPNISHASHSLRKCRVGKNGQWSLQNLCEVASCSYSKQAKKRQGFTVGKLLTSTPQTGSSISASHNIFE